MNKAAIGKKMAPHLYLRTMTEGMQVFCFAGSAVLAATLLFAGLSHLGLRPAAQEPASFEFLVGSATCLLATVIVCLISSRAKDRQEEELKSAWKGLYVGTSWKTPADESVVVSDVRYDAMEMEVRFDDGELRTVPFWYLTATDKAAPEADRTGLKPDNCIDWEATRSEITSIALHFVLCWGIAAVSAACMWRYGIPAWGFVPAVIAFFALVCLPVAACPDSWENVPGGDEDYINMVSKTRWKAMDGRIGTVRWAQREYKGEGRYIEQITLAFPEGDSKTFHQRDINPVVFEC